MPIAEAALDQQVDRDVEGLCSDRNNLVWDAKDLPGRTGAIMALDRGRLPRWPGPRIGARAPAPTHRGVDPIDEPEGHRATP